MATLENSFLGIDFENPFLLASAPPAANVESIDKAFELGWGGAALKTITPDDLVMEEVSPRYQIIKEKGKVIGFQNIELLSHRTVKYWCDGINYLKKNRIYIRALKQAESLKRCVRVTIGLKYQMQYVIEKMRDYEENCFV